MPPRTDNKALGHPSSLGRKSNSGLICGDSESFRTFRSVLKVLHKYVEQWQCSVMLFRTSGIEDLVTYFQSLALLVAVHITVLIFSQSASFPSTRGHVDFDAFLDAQGAASSVTVSEPATRKRAESPKSMSSSSWSSTELVLQSTPTHL